MRIRTIKPEFWIHEGLCGCSEFTRLLAIALLNWADDEGYFMSNPALLRGNLFPFLDSSKTIPGSLKDLSCVGWIELSVDSQGRSVGRILNFSKHQRVDKPKPSQIKELWTIQDESKNDPRMIFDESKEEGKGMERNGKEVSTEKEEEDIFQIWNSMPELPKIVKISPSRKASLKTRMKDPFFRENWRKGLDEIPTRSFMLGNNDRNWTADIDWFLKPDSLTKIIEGKYKSDSQPKPKSSPADLLGGRTAHVTKLSDIPQNNEPIHEHDDDPCPF